MRRREASDFLCVPRDRLLFAETKTALRVGCLELAFACTRGFRYEENFNEALRLQRQPLCEEAKHFPEGELVDDVRLRVEAARLQRLGGKWEKSCSLVDGVKCQSDRRTDFSRGEARCPSSFPSLRRSESEPSLPPPSAEFLEAMMEARLEALAKEPEVYSSCAGAVSLGVGFALLEASSCVCFRRLCALKVAS